MFSLDAIDADLAMWNLASLFEKRGNWDKVRHYLWNAVDVDPEWVECWKRLLRIERRKFRNIGFFFASQISDSEIDIHFSVTVASKLAKSIEILYQLLHLDPENQKWKRKWTKYQKKYFWYEFEMLRPSQRRRHDNAPEEYCSPSIGGDVEYDVPNDGPRQIEGEETCSGQIGILELNP